MVTLRAALIGDGRMGGEIRAIADTHDVEIVDVLGSADMNGDPGSRLAAVDVAIEFTEPGSAVDNIRRCLAAGCPVVVGTSGWYDRLDEVRAAVEKADGAALWAENFSPGYALLKRATERLVAEASGFEGYDVHIVETHHAAKRDAPSGTAARLRDRSASTSTCCRRRSR